jgi:hypothetical protein
MHTRPRGRRWRSAAPPVCPRINQDGRQSGSFAGIPIPRAAWLPDKICASFAATGRGWAHPTFTCRRPAPGRRAGWLDLQGPAASATAGLPVMAPTRSGAQGSRSCRPRLPHARHAAVFPGQAACSQFVAEKSPCVGAERQPVLRRAQYLLGPPVGCGVGTHAPVAPSPAPPAGLVVLEPGVDACHALVAIRPLPSALQPRGTLNRNSEVAPRQPTKASGHRPSSGRAPAHPEQSSGPDQRLLTSWAWLLRLGSRSAEASSFLRQKCSN